MYDLNAEGNMKVAKAEIFREALLDLFVVGENSNNGLCMVQFVSIRLKSPGC
jgi:hypothetical protein